MSPNASSDVADRVVERHTAVALANHYRQFEGLSITQIADRLGRSPATIKAYFYDPSDANKRPTDGPRGLILPRRTFLRFGWLSSTSGGLGF